MVAISDLEKELGSITKSSSSRISSTKVHSIMKQCVSLVKNHREVVDSLETFCENCPSEFKIYALYIIDAVIRQTPKRIGGKESNVYANRLAKNIIRTLEGVAAKCLKEEVSKVEKIISIWENSRIFPEYINKQLRLVLKETEDAKRNKTAPKSEEPEVFDDFDYGDEEADAQRVASAKRRRVEEEKRATTDRTTTSYIEPNVASGYAHPSMHAYKDHLELGFASSTSQYEPANQLPTVPVPSGYVGEHPNSHLEPQPFVYAPSVPVPDPSGVQEYYGEQAYPPQQYNYYEVPAQNRLNDEYYDHPNAPVPGAVYEEGTDGAASASVYHGYPAVMGTSNLETNYYPNAGHSHFPSIPVYSLTLWMGELPQEITEKEINDHLSPFGEVSKVVLNRNNKCAFIKMTSRQAAESAKDHLSGKPLGGHIVKWGWGKGRAHAVFKEKWLWKDGLSYIPVTKVNSVKDMKVLLDGSFVDVASIPEHLLPLYQQGCREIYGSDSIPIPSLPLPPSASASAKGDSQTASSYRVETPSSHRVASSSQQNRFDAEKDDSFHRERDRKRNWQESSHDSEQFA